MTAKIQNSEQSLSTGKGYASNQANLTAILDPGKIVVFTPAWLDA
jgi:hypothetical protein